MRTLGVVGIILQVYGPLLIIFFLYLRRYPQLCLMTIIGGFYYVLATILPSLLWLISSSSGFILPFSVVLQETALLVLFILLNRTIKAFDAKNTPLYSSRLGILPIAFVIGLGYGAAHSLLQLGSLLSFETSVPLSGWYDEDKCSALPFTYMQALIAFCFLYSHSCWAMTNFWAYSYISMQGLTSWDLLRHPLSQVHPIGVIAFAWGSHLFAAFLTLASCSVSIPLLMIVLALNLGMVYHVCEKQIAITDASGR